MRTAFRVVGWVVVGVFVLVVATCGLGIASRYYQTVTRIDATDQPPPSWLPAQATAVVLRGTQAACSFSGRCTRAEMEAWATAQSIPLQTPPGNRVDVYDMRAMPMGEKNIKGFHHDSFRIELDGTKTLIGSKYASNGGGISIAFDTATGNFYGNRSLW